MTVAVMNYFVPESGQPVDVASVTAGTADAIPRAVGDRWTTLSPEAAQRFREMAAHAETQPRRTVTATPRGEDPRFLHP